MQQLDRMHGKKRATEDASQPMRTGEATFCANCGEKLRFGAKFCHSCGAEVRPVVYQTEQTASAEPENATQPTLETSPAETGPQTSGYPQIPPNIGAQSTPQTTDPAPNARRKPLPRGAMVALFCLAALLLIAVAFGLGRCTGGKSVAVPDITATPQATAESIATLQPSASAEVSGADPGDVMDMPKLDSEGCDSDGMKLPVPGEGETLYLGALDYSGNAALSKIAFILSADGEQIHDITIFMKDLSIDLSEADAGISSLTVTESYQSPYDQDTFDRIDLGGSTLQGLTIEGNSASATLDYTYEYRPMNGGGTSTLIPFGTATVEFARIAGAGRAAASAGTDAAESATTPEAQSLTPVTFENTTYYVGIGQISTDEEGNRTVEIVGQGIGQVLPIRNGTMIMPIQASIECGGKTIGWNSASTSMGSLVFTFETTAEPELIYVYSFEDQDNDSAWATYDVSIGDFVSEY